jgi:hypothetical protein
MSITAYAQEICSVLDELELPRAVVNTQLDTFAAWILHFLSLLKVPEEDIKTWQQVRLFILKEAASSLVMGSG